VVDIDMPGMDGYEVARRMRAGGAGRPALLIALSARGDADHAEKSATAGFDHRLTKPAEPNDLAALLAPLDAGGIR
jgi:CheY-like chemotaxis protein